MKSFLTTLFFLSYFIPVFSCTCFPLSFCDYYENNMDNETTLIFKGSYLYEEEIDSWTKAVQYKVEKIYKGEIVTETSIYYTGESYVNTDSTVWLLSGSSASCLRSLGNTTAIFIVTYNAIWGPNDMNVGYVPTICATDYLPISDNNEVTGCIWETQDVTISLEELEPLLEEGCGITSTDDTIDDFNEFSIYPNPVNDILHIKCLDQCIVTNTELYDIRGNLIKRSNGNSIDMKHLSPGVYFVKAHSPQSNHIDKVIKI